MDQRGKLPTSKGVSAVPSVRGEVRRRLSLLLGSSFLAASLVAANHGAQAGNALPTGGQFAAGAGNITNSANGVVVNQSTARGIINWQSFSIGKGKSVDILNGAGATLNRVTGGDVTSIAGSLRSTGSVYVINPAGVIVLPTGKVVATGGFVASTRDLADSEFMSGGAQHLSGTSDGTVVNQGTIKSADGDVVLVGKSVSNSGKISAPNGAGRLVAGDSVLLQPAGSPIQVSTGSGNVTNSGTIEAAQAELNAAGGNVYALATNNGGVVRATGTATKDGRVYLTAGGDVSVDGTVSATNADGSGGTITTTAGGQTGTVTVNGAVKADATSASRNGGVVTVTGANVSVGATASLSADGGANGGKIFLGGDRHGGTDPSVALSNTKIATAKTTTIAAGATISASGGVKGGKGDGGDVIVWSDSSTSYAGNIAATAGKKGGDGGFVEVSGEHLSFTGTVSTLAPAGKIGQLLLDPSDINIVEPPTPTDNTGSSTSGGTTTYFPNGTGAAVSTILHTDIEAALASNDVVITTSNAAGSGTGNIVLSAAIDWDQGAVKGNHSLTLKADGTIIFAAGTTAEVHTGGAGNITLVANGDGVVAGGTVIQIGGNITATGGKISFIDATPGKDYRVVISNGITVTNTNAFGDGEVFFQADSVRLGNLINPQGFVVTPGNVVIHQTTAGAIQIGNNNTTTGSDTSFNFNSTLINQASLSNITANTLSIGDSTTTKLQILQQVAGGTVSVPHVQNLALITGAAGSVTTANTIAGSPAGNNISIGGGTGSLAVTTGGNIFLAGDGVGGSNSVGAIAIDAGGKVYFQDNAPGGTLYIGGAGGSGAVAGVSGIKAGGTVTLAGGGNIIQGTDAANAITASNLVLEGTGAFSLDNTANQIGNLAANAGSISLHNNQALTIASINDTGSTPTAVDGLKATGDISLVANGVLTINNGAPVVTTGGNARLETSDHFVNKDGTAALSAAAGHWRVYSQDPTHDVKGGLTSAQYQFVQYGAANSYADPFATADAALNVAATGNGFLYGVTPTVSESLVGSYSKVYDGTTLVVPSLTAVNYSGVAGAINGDTVVLTHPSIGNFTDKNVGDNKTITVTGIGLSSAVDSNGATVFGYNVVGSTSTTGSITPATITISALTTTKTYDGTVGALPTPSVTGLIAGDTISGVSESYVSPHVLGTLASTLVVDSAYAINDGNGGKNYNVVKINAPGTITAAALTISAVTQTKVYDGTTLSTLTPTFTGLAAGDTLTNLSQSYASRHVLGANGSLLVVNPGYVLSNASDYVVTVVNAAGTITPASLTVTATPDSKVYDGTTNATAKPAITAGTLFGSDTGNFIETYSSKNVGANILLTPSGSVSDGNGGADYTLNFVPLAAGSITPASLTISAVTDSKIYDGTTASSKTPIFTGLMAGDSLTNLSQAFASPNVLGTNGSTLVVNPGYVLSDGNGGGNYTVSLQTAQGTISPLAIAVNLHGTRIYDGTTDAPASILTITNNLDGNNLTLSGTGILASRNVGDQQLLSSGGALAGFTLGGSAAANYTLIGGTGDVIITPRAITVTAIANTKVFDGTAAALGTPLITSGTLVGGDAGSFTEAYETIHAGTNLKITPSGTVLDGNGGGNYQITFQSVGGAGNPACATCAITPEGITISAVTDTKTYDGTVVSTKTPTLTAGTLYNGDTLSNLSQAFTSRHVLGTNGSTLVVDPGYVLSHASDYTVTLVNAVGTINPAALTVTATPATKTFDGTVASLGTPTITSGQLYGSDTGSFTETYETIHAGTNIKITPSGTVTDGNGGADYAITFQSVGGAGNPACATCAITPEGITISAVTDTKTYDGTVVSTKTPTLTAGTLYNGDTLSNLSQAFTSRHVLGTNGSTLVVDPGYVLSHASDYAVTLVNAAGTINPAALTVTATPATKTFDGTVASLGKPTITSGQLYGSDTGNFTETYETIHAGTNIKITPSGTVTDGNGGADYAITFKSVGGAGNPACATCAITPEGITISAVTDTKTYDGTVVSTKTPTLTAGTLFNGDTLSNLSQAFTSRHVLGTNGSTLVVNSGYTLTNASDYAVTLVNAVGTINPAALTVTATPATKTFDGTVASLGTPTITSGQLYGSDTGSFTETYETIHAGTNIKITPSGTVTDGNGGADYAITFKSVGGAGNPACATCAITPEGITISAVTDTKTYDGTVVSTKTPTLTAGTLYNGDTLSNLSQAFTSRHVLGTNGSTLVVNSGYTLTNASDYAVTLVNAVGTINPAALTVTATPATKTFDGTVASLGTPTITSGQLYGSDTGNFTETYETIHAGTNIKITPSGTVTDGNGGADYAITFKSVGGAGNPACATCAITPEGITISAVTDTKTYDGTTVSTKTPTLTVGTLYNGDTLSNLSQAFASRHVLGTNGSTLVVDPGYVLSHASDYAVTLVNAVGTINPLAVVVSGTRVYDGTTNAGSSILTVTNAVAGDTVTVSSGTGTLASRNAGNEALTSFGTLTLGGGSASDYTVVGGSGTVRITPEAITVTAVGGTKVYDGTTTGPGTPIVTTGTIYGPDSGHFIETYGSPNAGKNITLTPSGSVTDGNGGGNYVITFVPATTGVIDPRPVVVTGTRPFDGTPNAPGQVLVITNVVPGDDVHLTGTGTLISPAVGKEPIVSWGSLTPTGGSASNYTVVGGTGTVLVTPVLNFPTRRDQTVAGLGVDPYRDIVSTDGFAMAQPGESGFGTCVVRDWFEDDDGDVRPICNWVPGTMRGRVLGTFGTIDTSGYLVTAHNTGVDMPVTSAQRSHTLYHQLRNK